MYGLCSCTGRHFCLKCLATAADAKVQQGKWTTKISPRTLDCLKDDYDRFTTAGADHSRAKEFNNVIAEPFFDIPLDQVCAFAQRLL